MNTAFLQRCQNALRLRMGAPANFPPLPEEGTPVALGAEQMALVWIAMLREGAELLRRYPASRSQKGRCMFLAYATKAVEAEARKAITTHYATGGRNAAALLEKLAEAMA